MKKRRIQMTFDAEEADIIEAYAKAKGFRSIGDFARLAMEQSMNRAKVQDLHERLINWRMGRKVG
mgnify:CR=1 FL=1